MISICFARAVGPLAESGRLGAILAQFPPSFKDTDESRGYLDWLLGGLAAYPVAVELRHRSWSDESARTLALLKEHRAAWTLIDEPKFESSIRQALERGARSRKRRSPTSGSTDATPRRGGTTPKRKTGTTICIQRMNLRRFHKPRAMPRGANNAS
jgi:uncharacterized protein YecE (DUF72 family)